MEESREDFQHLKEFFGYVEINDEVATNSTRSIDRMITDKMSSADASTIVVEDNRAPILLVTNAFD